MTKAEFFARRDKMRQAGLIEDYQPKNYQNDLLPDEEQRLLNALGNQKSAIFKTQEVGLTGLLCVELYIGKQIKCQRKKIDELDNITVWRI